MGIGAWLLCLTVVFFAIIVIAIKTEDLKDIIEKHQPLGWPN